MCELMETANALRETFIVVPVSIGSMTSRGAPITCKSAAELDSTLTRLQATQTASSIEIYKLSKTLSRRSTWEPV